MTSAAAEHGFRTRTGGRIDRTRSVGFRFDGERYQGFVGDTLASALLANGVHLVGRSYKYHRPRGIVSAGVEEPNALVQLGIGARTEPNVRAPLIELFDGLSATSQNAWPSPGFDLGAINGWFSALLPAGFYYKTFMWPASWWQKVFEPVIRNAAGLGRAPKEPDPDRYEHNHLWCDVLVVGAGPSGLMAALAAAKSGARVVVAEQDRELGGALLREPVGVEADLWLEQIRRELQVCPEVTLLTRTQITGYYDHNYLLGLERVSDHLGAAAPASMPRLRLHKIRAKQVVLATGAIERPLVFTGNDLPGVMLAGAVRTYLNRFAVLPGRKVVVQTNNDSAYSAALDLARAGARVTVADLRSPANSAAADEARAAGIEVLDGYGIVAARGGRRVKSVELKPLAADAKSFNGTPRHRECDLLAVSGGWVPTIHLHSQSRGRPAFDEARGIFLPGPAIQDERSAGACAGIFGTRACLSAGAEAGAEAARAAGFDAEAPALPELPERDEAPMRPIFLLPRRKPTAKAFIDQQNDVKASDIELTLREGYRSIEHVKRYTTTGMGTDQGKTSNLNALALVSATTGQPIPEIGVTTFRPPYTPLTFGAIVGRNTKHLFDPVRQTPMHDWHVANGAVFEDVGTWKRPFTYPRAGEDVHAAVAREVAACRASCGVLDATTLGKIDIQGRDAAEFLNRIYTNAWSKLGIGRCRYGLMLGEDGMVFDDGVTTCLAEHHYLMSTTSGGAARVLAWLENWLQTEWPELKVFCTSVTEQWATISMSGPNTRELVAELASEVDLSPDAFPHMSMREGRFCGVPARIFRISFTGELGFEVQVPANYGLGVWERVIEAGRKYDLTPYGTEAMHVLRAEKGYIIAGQDTDGTVTPFDLGMDWAVSKKKPDFIGKRSLARADMDKPGRKQLVGLLTKDPNETLEEGAQIVADPKQAIPMTMIGHVSSSYWSPNQGRAFALALVRDGRAKMGETLFVPLLDRTVEVVVSEPVFIDKEGERLRA